MSLAFDSQRQIQSAKDEILGQGPAAFAPDLELVRSWERSKAAIGVPSNIRDVPQVADELLDAHLLDMFRAPLTKFSDDLSGTGLGLLLADAKGQILQRWSHDSSVVQHLDRLGTMRGAVLAEDVVGTNGVGTVIATGKTVQINGTEHFADFYSTAMCTGGPIRHPLTGKLLAVITLSSELSPKSKLLLPLLHSVTTQLEQHVLDVEQPESRRMFDAFLSISRDATGPVIAFGPQGLMMQSRSASRLSSDDLALLQRMLEDGRPAGRYRLELSDGAVDLQLTTLDHGDHVVMAMEKQLSRTPVPAPRPRAPLAGRSSEWLAAVNVLGRQRDASVPLIIAGEPGVGKTSLALGFPFRPGSVHATGKVVDAAERHIQGLRKWLQSLTERLSTGAPLVIRGVETLDAPALDGLRSVLENTPHPGRVLLTLTAADSDEADSAARRLNAGCLWLPPLRERFTDIPALWHALSSEDAVGAGLQPTSEAIEVLRAYRWPGNVKELRAILGELVRSGKKGVVTPEDLPAAMRSAKVLSLIERVELEAIRKALDEAEGNRAKAAEILGLSRATVYRKMKAYHLTA
ncbi:sigma-54-dependent Fis family transcriptional regulator [Lysinimonas soli]|uniref:Sigma-54-dependent Fis family transcriptional regulator n=1 Tax=Lysinimonas soli TaxID=1074233 RepID=A0ABW0NSX1_9MICO